MSDNVNQDFRRVAATGHVDCTARLSMIPMPRRPHHLAAACTDATAHPRRGHHRTTSYTSRSVRSPGRSRPHRQVRRPGTTAPSPRSHLPFLPSTRHTSSPFYSPWSACRRRESTSPVSVFTKSLTESRVSLVALYLSKLCVRLSSRGRSHDNSAAAGRHPTVHVHCKAQGAYLCLSKLARPRWFWFWHWPVRVGRDRLSGRTRAAREVP